MKEAYYNCSKKEEISRYSFWCSFLISLCLNQIMNLIIECMIPRPHEEEEAEVDMERKLISALSDLRKIRKQN